ncbi:MAG: replicative DNA helicase [Bacteroidales bacterium]|nr:replicative DNA helicase [Bacteroidales bacterium]
MDYSTAFSLNGKVPPQAVEIEEAVLGALMLDKDALTGAIETLRPEYFYKSEHQLIFRAIHTLFELSKDVDILTVVAQLRHDGNLQAVGGAYYVSQLTNKVVSAAHIENHARILSEKYIQRELIRVSTETIRDSYDETQDALDLLDRAQQGLFEVSDKNFHSDYVAIEGVVDEALEQIKAGQESKDNLTGIPTGFTDLDRITAGFHPGTLIILAARPAMGKTAFALSIARNMAVEFNRPVAFFSLEMTAIELTMRLLQAESHIPGEKLKKGEKLTKEETERLYEKANVLKNAPIIIDQTPQLSIFELRAKCRRLQQSHGIQMVFVDYLQLMQAGSDMSRNGNREQEISTISRQLKSLSKELGIPVLALSQLSRDVEKRGGSKKPQLSDLRESGAIEQDADIVMFIYRPDYYGMTEDDEKGSVIGMADINIEKHRSGATGSCRLRFVREFARFENPTDFTSVALAGLSANQGFDAQGTGGVDFVTMESGLNNLDHPDDFSMVDNGDTPF